MIFPFTNIPCPTSYQFQDSHNFRLSWRQEDEGSTQYTLVAEGSDNEQNVTVEGLSTVVRELPSWKNSIFAKADKTIVKNNYKRNPILLLKSRNFPSIVEGFIFLSKEMSKKSTTLLCL